MALRANAVAFGVFSVDFSLLHGLQKQDLRMPKIYIRLQKNYIRLAKIFYTVRNLRGTVYKFIFIRLEIFR